MTPPSLTLIYTYLIFAIIAEVIATTALKASVGFTRLGPSMIVVVGYSIAFYLLSLSLKVLPVGIAYAIWAGLGIVLATVAGVIIYKEALDLPALLGIGLILTGVMVINVFSQSVGH